MFKAAFLIAVFGVAVIGAEDMRKFCASNPAQRQAEVQKHSANVNRLTPGQRQALQKCAKDAFGLGPQDKDLATVVRKICSGNQAKYQKCVASLPRSVQGDDKSGVWLALGGSILIAVVACIFICFG